MARNEAAGIGGGYGPRSLAGSSPGKDNFSSQASASCPSSSEDSKDKMPAPLFSPEK